MDFGKLYELIAKIWSDHSVKRAIAYVIFSVDYTFNIAEGDQQY